MIDRGIQPKGFYNDDAARLQEEFNREHVAEREARMQQRMQLAAKSYLRETVHRRRMEREKELREEVEEVAKSPQLEVWLELIKAGSSEAQPPPRQASLRLSSIGTRALCKSLAFNHSLHALNLSRNGLDDMAGKCLATMLRRNTSLQRLELESNNFGPATAKELAGALTENESLQALNLESNPLTDDEKDFSGVAALGAMLVTNWSLKTLNLWRTRLGTEGGKQIAMGLEKNTTLVCLDIGNNRIATLDGVKIDQRLSRNRVAFEASEQKKIGFRQAQLAAAEKEQERQEQVQKQVEYVSLLTSLSLVSCCGCYANQSYDCGCVGTLDRRAQTRAPGGARASGAGAPAAAQTGGGPTAPARRKESRRVRCARRAREEKEEEEGRQEEEEVSIRCLLRVVRVWLKMSY